MKFICDQMLGSLAKWLRVLGYDTLYVKEDMPDEEILEIAGREERIIISRDKLLTQKGRRMKLLVIEITSIKLQDQIQQVFQHVTFNDDSILSRCLICNNVLQPLDKKMIKDKNIPSKILDQHYQFYYCSKCNKIYWMGTHYKNMM
ncbi:MAG: Mut7-C RNAse domain-containing protein, partial [Candidatus Thermoplasmatota archaeon]